MAFRPFAETQTAMTRLEESVLEELQRNIDQALSGTFPSLQGVVTGSKRAPGTPSPPSGEGKKQKLTHSAPQQASENNTKDLQIRQLQSELSSTQKELVNCRVELVQKEEALRHIEQTHASSSNAMEPKINQLIGQIQQLKTQLHQEQAKVRELTEKAQEAPAFSPTQSTPFNFKALEEAQATINDLRRQLQQAKATPLQQETKQANPDDATEASTVSEENYLKMAEKCHQLAVQLETERARRAPLDGQSQQSQMLQLRVEDLEGQVQDQQNCIRSLNGELDNLSSVKQRLSEMESLLGKGIFADIKSLDALVSTFQHLQRENQLQEKLIKEQIEDTNAALQRSDELQTQLDQVHDEKRKLESSLHELELRREAETKEQELAHQFVEAQVFAEPLTAAQQTLIEHYKLQTEKARKLSPTAGDDDSFFRVFTADELAQICSALTVLPVSVMDVTENILRFRLGSANLHIDVEITNGSVTSFSSGVEGETAEKNKKYFESCKSYLDYFSKIHHAFSARASRSQKGGRAQ